jgi:hypothetical protein
VSPSSSAIERTLATIGTALVEGDLAGLDVEHLLEVTARVQPEGEAAVGFLRLAGLDPARAPEGEVHLVAVVPGVLAGEHGLDALGRERREEAREQALLGGELGGIGETLEAAAAAARDVRTARRRRVRGGGVLLDEHGLD